MRLKAFRVQGFQSFADSGTLELEDGFNIIVGQNNSGKSALLRAIHSLSDDRHRMAHQWRDHLLAEPKSSLLLDFFGEEFADEMLRRGSSNFLPVPSNGDPEQFAKEFVQRPSVELYLENRPNNTFRALQYPSHDLFHFNGQPHVAASGRNVGGALVWDTTFVNYDTIPETASNIWLAKMFHFNAERFGVGQSERGHSTRLTPNAINLPAVLDTLLGNSPDLFRKLVGHMRDIFPTIAGVGMRPVPSSNDIEIRIWPSMAQSAVELSFPLNNSGTGVSQVLAILTAVMTVSHAVIIIDEINSFLHPAATKALLRVLQTEYPDHQYIISTHSPEVIASSNVSTLHLVRRDGFESRVDRLNVALVSDLRSLTSELGVSFSDVFASDRILWVEGPTEELCFPVLYQYAAGQPKPRGTIVSAVTNTGDWGRKKDRHLIHRIYEKLSAAALISAAAISLDRDNLTENERDDLSREAKGRMYFLPRRHFECYLVSPKAISAFINSKDKEAVTTAETVASKIAEVAATGKYGPGWSSDIEDVAWLETLDAAKLISEVCRQIAEGRAPFSKNRDSEYLLSRLMEERAEGIQGLAEYVRRVIDALQDQLPPDVS